MKISQFSLVTVIEYSSGYGYRFNLVTNNIAFINSALVSLSSGKFYLLGNCN